MIEKQKIQGYYKGVMLRKSHENKAYREELRKQAVEAYLRDEYSLQGIIKRFRILDNRSLRIWIKMYNGHREIKHRCARFQ